MHGQRVRFAALQMGLWHRGLPGCFHLDVPSVSQQKNLQLFIAIIMSFVFAQHQAQEGLSYDGGGKAQHQKQQYSLSYCPEVPSQELEPKHFE